MPMPSPPSTVLRLAALAACAALLGGCVLVRPVGGPKTLKKSELPFPREVDGDRVRAFLRPDAIPAIHEPQLVPASEADFMAEEELVVGVVHGGVAKAYSLWHLDKHEIVNDEVGRYPIAVTW